MRRGRTGLAVPRGRGAEDMGWGTALRRLLPSVGRTSGPSRVPSVDPGAEQVGVGGLEELGRTGETIFALFVDSLR